MATIKLLAASTDIPITSEVSAEYMSLVPAGRLELANRTAARNDTAYPNDSFVWSASASADGSFHFYAIPSKSYGSDDTAGQSDSFYQAPSSDWYRNNAVFQYTLHASMPTPMSGQLINLYA